MGSPHSLAESKQRRGLSCFPFFREIYLIIVLINFISEFNNQKKTIASICSASQLLISAKVVKGRKIAGYYSMEDDLINAGAIYTDKPSVVDNNIITTAHYKDMGPWMKATLNFFNENSYTRVAIISSSG